MRAKACTKARRARRYQDVAGEREIGAGAGSDTVHRADDRDREGADLQDQRVVMRQQPVEVRPGTRR